MSSFYKKTLAPKRSVITVSEHPTRVNSAIKPVLLEKYLPKQYESPAVQDMAIVIVFFNPTQSIRIMQNLLYTKALFDAASIPTFYGELAFDDKPFILPCASNIVQWRSSSYMFYKENLIVQLEAKIPTQYTKLCIMDADIVFEDSGWYEKVSKALDSYTIIQPYSLAHILDFSFRKYGTKISCLKEFNGHSGFAWAFQRSWFQRNPFYEHALIGGGDSFFCILLGLIDKITTAYITDLKAHAPPEIHTKNYVDICIYHLPHGKRENRQFLSRHAVLQTQLRAFGITSMRDLTLRRDDGILVWKPEYMEVMNKLIIQYFKTRDDDGI